MFLFIGESVNSFESFELNLIQRVLLVALLHQFLLLSTALLLTKPPGLTVGGDHNIYSQKEGYVVFVCSKYDVRDIDKNCTDDTEDGISNEDGSFHSKEADVANLYRTLVYHPFVRDVRMSQYGWSGIGPVPDHLAAVSWMDGVVFFCF